MSYIDLIILIPIAYGLVRGLMHGFVQELTTLVSLIAAIVCTKLWAPEMSQWLSSVVTWDEKTCQLTAWLIIFIAVALLLHLAGKLLNKLLSAISLGGINRLAGAIFGAAKWALIVSLLLCGFELIDNTFHLLRPEQKCESIAYEPVRKIAAITWDTIQNEMQQH
ncbi:MAG: CvpA family protein [Paludibacter sp.]|nr:CvpA family protein [Bacteroidales bacterium]MCM1068809.1 CvpA family protein [Prevotella sp.]MCM1353950.1 CvpA family protein [Bacteroides sp.]MCM1443348.1 CvpA family protein [Muribaculum sp.]MCM1482111.1 CvpA family protein [Paludibacter sp.]